MDRPTTTLFMLMSVDGKISTGDTDEMDVDRDFPKLDGINEGLHQYYEIEKTTDLYSLNTGKVFDKIGVNKREAFQNDVPAHFVIVDSKPHLTSEGILHLSKKTKGVTVVTTNEQHPAVALSKGGGGVEVLLYPGKIDFPDVFSRLRNECGVEKLTVQSGGTLNTVLVREGLIDRVLLIVAPALVGGKDTPSLTDGESLHDTNELSKIKPLTLVQSKPLENSYLLLEYRVG